MKRALIAAALCISARAWSQPADPVPDKETAATHFAEGQRRFNTGEFLPAAAEFEAAYALDPGPVYLYNIAQAYRRGSACARAADYYRRFLTVVPNPPNLAKVTRYLDELDACAKAEAPAHVEPPPQPAPIAPVAPTPVSVRTNDDSGRFERRLAIAASAVGVGMLGLGAWFTHDVHTLEGYAAALCAPGAMCEWDAGKQARVDDLKRRGDRATDLSIGAYAFGGAALVGGAVLYMLGNRTPAELAPVQGGAVVVTSFAF